MTPIQRKLLIALLFSITLASAIVVLQFALRSAPGERPGLILFLLPIAGAAWLGGLLRRTARDDVLRATTDRLQLLIDHAPAAVAMLDRDMRYLAVSRRFVTDYRLGRSDLVGRSHYDVFPELPERWRVIHRRCLAGAVERCAADPFPRADGTLDWVRWEIRPWHDAGGHVGGIILFSEIVTEQKRAEDDRAAAHTFQRQTTDAIAAEKERLAVILRSIGDAVVATDCDGRITLLNPEAERMTGWRAADAIGRPFSEVFRLVGEHTRVPVADPVAIVLRDGVTIGLANHTALIRRDGSQIPIADCAAPIRDGTGRCLGVVLVCRDQTGTRDAERALREKDELLRAISDAIPDPIFLKDRASRWLYANPGALAVVGRRAEDALGRSDQELYTDPAVGRALIETDLRIMESGRTEVTEETVLSPEGYRTYLSTKTPFRNAAGEIIGLLGCARDITDRKQMEETVRQREVYFRALIEKSSDITVVLDANGIVTFWSPAAEEQLGWTAAEMVGKPYTHIMPSDERRRSERRYLNGLPPPGSNARYLRRQARKDGALRVLDVIARNLLHDPAVRGLVLNVRDITEQQRLTEQFQQAQKLESVARLAGGVAHDFNNLLTVILTCGEGLRDDLDHGVAPNAEDVDAIRAAAERARELTRQLLAFARRQIVAPATLDLNGLLRGSHKLLGRLLGEDIDLRVHLQPELWTTVADPGQMEQVVLNLCVNARDAMPRGGTLVIETRNQQVGAAEAAADPELRAGDWVVVSVHDTGMGMTADVKEHLFEPFFTTKEQGKGTGLGLASVYGIVKQAGGHLRVQSEPGQGATFFIHLPRAALPAVEARAASPGRATGGSETIVLAEDEAPVRMVMVRALRGAGYRVLAAESGAAALELAAREPGPVHLVLTDVVMPGLDGRGLVEELRKIRGGFRVLYVSGYTHDIIGHRGILDAGIELLPKPFTATALLERVRRILDAR